MRDLSEQVVVVTGATNGLGRHVVRELAGSGATVVAHGRDPAKLSELRDELTAVIRSRGSGSGSGGDDGDGHGDHRVQTVQADLADLRQVDRLAADLVERLDRLDVLVNNAGIGPGPPEGGRETSVQGYERRFAVNYLAGYHLTRQLVPLLVASAPARVVNVASIGQEALDFDDLQLERGYSGFGAYRRSKLAQVMFTFDLADELAGRGVTVNALHPATFMDTFMVREGGVRPISTVEEGAEATLRLIASHEVEGVTGRFFDRTRESRPDPQADDAEARARLRRISGDLVAAALGPHADRPAG
jgi:NAD(P)-dependent dehydrogenase (short-subunit alcohol dehydrogenase family)